MFLKLNHQKLQVFQAARDFALECYKLSKCLPVEERFNMVQQIRRASVSVILNIAEGASRKSEIERKRYYEVSRGSIIEIDASLDIANELGYLTAFDCMNLKELMNKTFSMLSKMLH